MPKNVDARVWMISQRCQINAAVVWEDLKRLVWNNPAPSADDLKKYNQHWEYIALTLERKFGP